MKESEEVSTIVNVRGEKELANFIKENRVDMRLEYYNKRMLELQPIIQSLSKFGEVVIVHHIIKFAEGCCPTLQYDYLYNLPTVKFLYGGVNLKVSAWFSPPFGHSTFSLADGVTGAYLAGYKYGYLEVPETKLLSEDIIKRHITFLQAEDAKKVIYLQKKKKAVEDFKQSLVPYHDKIKWSSDKHLGGSLSNNGLQYVFRITPGGDIKETIRGETGKKGVLKFFTDITGL